MSAEGTNVVPTRFPEEEVFDAKIAMVNGLKAMEKDSGVDARPWMESVLRAEPMWVDSNLSKIVIDASESISVREQLRQETVFPALEAFCLFDSATDARWALTWHLTDDQESIGAIGIMLDSEYALPWPCPFIWDFGEGFEGRYIQTVNEEHEQVYRKYADDLAALALTLWKIAAERIAIRSHVSLERHARKRVQKLGLEPSDVTVIRLRRSRSSSREEGESVEYSHRFLVRGHWRNQWYPLDREHRQRWVSTYVKGPEGKPLILKQRQFELSR